MSFSKVNPGGFASGDTLTHTQVNALDADHANSLDKSVAGDTINGTVNFAGVGGIQANQTGSITTTIASGIEGSIAGGIQPTVAGGITTAVTNGIQSTVAGGLIPTVAGGISSSVAGGIQGTASGAIQGTSAGGISATVASGIESNAAGGIALNGGTSDWPTCLQNRTVTPVTLATPLQGSVSSGWNNTTLTIGLTASATTTAQAIGPFKTHNGSSLTTVRFFLKVATHSALPAVFPLFQVVKHNLTTNTGLVLSSASATAVSAAAWNATTFWDLTVASDVIDNTTFIYYAQIVDENGAGAVAGNIYLGVRLTMNNIANMQFAQ